MATRIQTITERLGGRWVYSAAGQWYRPYDGVTIQPPKGRARPHWKAFRMDPGGFWTLSHPCFASLLDAVLDLEPNPDIVIPIRRRGRKANKQALDRSLAEL